MTKIAHETLIAQLNWRYAVKKFDSTKKIPEKDWETLEEVLRLSASSFGLQPYQFIIVQNQEIRKKLTPASWGQTQIEDCSHLVVLAYLKSLREEYVANYITKISQVRGVPEAQLNEYKQMMINYGRAAAEGIPHWAARQSYIAMGSFMTAAALLEVDVCPMEGIEPAKYDEILGLTDSDYSSVAALATGYRSSEDASQFAKKVRLDKNNIFKVI